MDLLRGFQLSGGDLIVFLGFGNAIVLFVTTSSLAEKHRKAARYLGLFILLYTVELLNWTILPSLRQSLGIFIPFLPVLFFIPAMAYCFINAIGNANFRIAEESRWYLLPGILLIPYQVVGYSVLFGFPKSGFATFFVSRAEHFLYEGLGVLFSFVVLYAALRQYRNLKITHEATVKHYRYAFYFISFIMIRWITTYSMDLFFPGTLPQSVFYGLYAIEIFLLLLVGYRSVTNPKVLAAGHLNNSRMGDADDLKRQAEELRSLIVQNKLYLNKDLNRQHLSSEMGVSDVYISSLLKHGMGTTFYDLVNEFRTQEVMQKLDNGQGDTYTLDYLAEEAGFKSKATFVKYFKRATGMTPMHYRQKRQN